MAKKIKPEFFVAKDSLVSPFDHLAVELGIETAAGKIFLRRALENAVLMDGKQQDYGSKNISDFGLIGVVVRMNDKFQRIKNLMQKKSKKSINESIRDSFVDVSNYAIIAMMVDDKEWPNE